MLFLKLMKVCCVCTASDCKTCSLFPMWWACILHLLKPRAFWAVLVRDFTLLRCGTKVNGAMLVLGRAGEVSAAAARCCASALGKDPSLQKPTAPGETELPVGCPVVMCAKSEATVCTTETLQPYSGTLRIDASAFLLLRNTELAAER